MHADCWSAVPCACAVAKADRLAAASNKIPMEEFGIHAPVLFAKPNSGRNREPAVRNLANGQGARCGEYGQRGWPVSAAPFRRHFMQG